MKCKYCSKDCKLDYCSIQCAKRRTKILLDIDNRKKQQKRNRRKFTTEELEKFETLKNYLNGNVQSNCKWQTTAKGIKK